MPDNFDEAIKATEEMFANENEPPQVQNEETPPVEEAPPEKVGDDVDDVEERNAMIDEATHAAEVATQAATERDEQLRQALMEMEQIKAQNMQLQDYTQQLQSTVEELSQRNEQHIVEELMEAPVLDINGLAFADEETQQAAMAKYAEELSAYNKKQLMDELAPAIEFAKKGMYDAEKQEVIEALSQIPQLNGIKEILPQLDRLIEKNRWLSSDDMPIEDKYINAYAMARGVNSINTPPPEPEKEKTADEIFELYKNNPAFQELVEKDMLERAKQSQQVPPFSASSGAVNAALNIKEKPQTLEEASKRTREMFGMM